MRNRTAARLILALLAAGPAPAAAANTIGCWKVIASQPCAKYIVGDTEAGLPSSGVPEGVPAWAKDTDRLVCYYGGSWQPCNAGGGGGLASTDIDTSAELRTILTDEVGTGALMFGLDPAMVDGLTCSADQVVKRNAGDTAFECGTAAATASDLSCSDCIGGTEIDESSLILSGAGLTHPQIMARLAVGGGF